MFSREYDKLALFAQTATTLISYYWIQLSLWRRFAKHEMEPFEFNFLGVICFLCTSYGIFTILNEGWPIFKYLIL